MCLLHCCIMQGATAVAYTDSVILSGLDMSVYMSLMFQYAIA